MKYEVMIIDEKEEKLIRKLGNRVITAYFSLTRGKPEQGKKLRMSVNDLNALVGFASRFLFQIQQPKRSLLSKYRIRNNDERKFDKDAAVIRGEALIIFKLVDGILKQNLENKKVVFKVI